MEQLLTTITEFSTVSVLIRLLLAALFGGAIGWERGHHGRAAGLRTHILVCLGATLTALTGLFAPQVLGIEGDVFRISAQVVSGIGFLGVGMILVRNNTVVMGLTTAAGLWATATIGIALGYGFYTAALTATVVCAVVLPLLGHVEGKRKTVTNIYLEISDTAQTGVIVRQLRALFHTPVVVDVVQPKSNAVGRVGILLLIRTSTIPDEVLTAIETIDGIDFAVEECNA